MMTAVDQKNRLRGNSSSAHVLEMGMFRLTWPIVAAFAFGITLPLEDSFFLSRYSQDAASGTGALLPLFLVFHAALTALTQAGGSVVSQYQGGFKNASARASSALSLINGFVFGLLGAVILAGFRDSLVSALGLQGQAAEYGRRYLLYLGLGFPLKGIQLGLMNLLSARGETRWNLLTVFLMNVTNVTLNGLTMKGFIFGGDALLGVCMATLISWTLAALLGAWRLFGHLGVFFRKWEVRRRAAMVQKEIMRIGIPGMLEPVSFQLFQLAIVAVIVSMGSQALLARVYTSNLVMLTLILSMGVGFGCQILVAHLSGAGHFKRAMKEVQHSARLAALGSLALSSAIYLAAHWLFGLFNAPPEVEALGRKLLFIELFLEPIRAMNIVYGFSLRASGDSRYQAIAGISMMWGLGFSAILVLGHFFGLPGIWLGMLLDESLRAIVYRRRWRSGAWMTKGVIQHTV